MVNPETRIHRILNILFLLWIIPVIICILTDYESWLLYPVVILGGILFIGWVYTVNEENLAEFADTLSGGELFR